MKFKNLLLIIVVILFLFSSISAQNDSEIPSIAHSKAIKALEKLGPNRGASKLSFKVLDIIGVASGLKIDVQKVKKNLEDLNAKVSDTQIEIALSGDVLFDFDKWDLREDALNSLKKIVAIIEAYKSTRIEISGHTDSKGKDEYNMKLSLKRAQSVRDWMIKNSSLKIGFFKIKGLGEKKPIAPNLKKDGSDNPQGRQKNRRVEFIIDRVKLND